MSFDLLESAKSLFTGDVISKAASQLGESEGGIQKALSGIIPTVLTGLLHKTSSQGDAASVLDMAKNAAPNASAGSIGSMLEGGAGGLLNKGADILKGLFGDKAAAISGMIASYAGIRESSANTLLNSAAPATVGTLGQYASQNNLGPSGLMTFLNTQKDKILAAVPGGLNLAGVLGLASLGDLGKKLGGMVSGVTGGARDAANAATHTVAKTAGNNRWIWSLLLILVAVILLWYLMRGCGGEKKGNMITDTASTVQMTDSATMQTTPPVAIVQESIQVTLPDGTVLNAYRGGIEDQMVTFLKDNSKAAGKDVWFDFDNLNFKTGSAEISPESMKQIDNIAAILVAFPKTKIKIGGYTDKSGSEPENKKLSTERAMAVEGELKKLHTNPSQLTGAEGYGSEFAKAAASAPDEERKHDRHISVGVREK
jgi:outer membrane protein OmpA-like peptidoglycan-associated protein